MKLLDPENLAKGTERQKSALQTLREVQIFDILKDHSPVLTGCLPLDVDTPESSINVVCSSENLEEFAALVQTKLGECKDFRLRHTVIRGLPAVTASFHVGAELINLCGQSASVFTQSPVLLMLVEARLLAFSTPGARERIRELKNRGLSTEGAFAEVYEIKGDATEELLKLASQPDRELLIIAHRHYFRT